MSTPVRKRVKVETSESGRRYVSTRELIRGELERIENKDNPSPLPPPPTPQADENNDGPPCGDEGAGQG